MKTPAIMTGGRKTRTKLFFKLLILLPVLFLFSCGGGNKNSDTLMNGTLEKINTRFLEKNAEMYAFIERARLNDARAVPLCEKANDVKKISIDMFDYLSDLKINPDHLIATELKTKLKQYNELMLSFAPEEKKDNFIKNYPVTDPGAPDVAMLSKLQSDVLLFENDMISVFAKKTEGGPSFKFDGLEAVIIPNFTSVSAGEKYEATIFLSAYSSINQPDIVFGEFNVDNFKVNEVKPEGTLITNGGKAKYTVTTSAPGRKTYSGVIV